MFTFTLEGPVCKSEAADIAIEIESIYDVPQDLSGKTVILHSNDVHGAISRYPYIASVKENFSRRGAEVILVDCGDFSQGTEYVAYTKGEDAIVSMNAAGYQFATLGNHEFDFGFNQLRKNLVRTKFKVICSNILDDNGNCLFEPNAMYTTKSGLELGFFGVTTSETITGAKPDSVAGMNVISGEDLYSCGQAQVNTLRDRAAALGSA